MLGFLNIYKPTGMTSNAVVQKIKKRFKISKIGHMGTLDPMACGVLPIAIGKATRLFDYSLNKTKRYTAIFDFGYTTDSLDITGAETNRDNKLVEEQDIINACSKLIGKIAQIPPNFSAKHINGKRAYDLARDGIEFKLNPKDITIYQLNLMEKLDINRFKFDILCSSGTYIRSIARDLGELLGTYGCMSFLERTETGEFNKETAIDIDKLLADYTGLEDCLLSPLEVFKNVPQYVVDDNVLKNILDGKKVKIKLFEKETFIINNNKIVGIAMPNEEYLKLSVFLYE